MSQTTELDRSPSTTDRASETQPRQNGGLANLDRVALLKEGRATTGSASGDAGTGAAATARSIPTGKSGDLHFNDVYKQSGVDSAIIPKPTPKMDPDAGGVSVGNRTLGDRLAPASLRSRPEQVDPTKRNALVLDTFQDGGRGTEVLGTKSHGGAIADGMRANKFNVYTADLNAPGGKADSNNNDLAASFNGVAKQIDNGQLPLKSGDVVTASFGSNAQLDKNGKVVGGDPTYAQASQMLKMNITPDNVQAQTPQIIDRLGKVSQGLDPETGKPTDTSDADKETAKFAYDSNKAIQGLQGRGISVISAAGNDGPDRVSLGALSATRLSSNDSAGKPDGFSATDSGTKKADGVIPIKSVEPSLMDPTPIKNQKERAQVGDGGRITDAPVFGNNGGTLDRSKLGPGYGDNSGAFVQNPKPEVSSQTAFGPPEQTPSSFSKTHLEIPPIFSTAGNPPGDMSKVVNAKTKTVAPDAAIAPPPSRLVGVDAGTSFSVLDFTKGKADRSVPLFDQ